MISFEFVADNFDELEADFQREYGIDLREALYGEKPVGGRRLTALINGLSPESATMRKVHSGGIQWGQQEELLAALCEMLDTTNRLLFLGFQFKGQVWDPIEITRPGQEEKTKASTVEQLVSFFGTMAASADSVVVSPAAADSSEEEGVT